MHFLMKKYIFIVLPIFLIGVGIFYFLATKNGTGSGLTDSQKQQALKKLLGRTPVLVEQKTTDTRISHENLYVSFLYPKIAKIYTKYNQNALQQKNILDSFSFTTDTPKILAVVQVVNSPDISQLTDFPAVSLRLQDSSYMQSLISIDSFTATSFEKEVETVEKSAFFMTKGRVYAIVVSGINKEDVNLFFEKFIASFSVPR